MAWQEVVDRSAMWADEWAFDRTAADPSFGRIIGRVAEAVRRLLKTESFPRTREDVIDLCERALASVHHQTPRPAAGS